MEASKRKQRVSRERGITLVALVITIVVIIILAVVTINFAFGEGGIVKQAQSAADYYANDTKYTEESLSNVTAYLNGVLNGSNIGGDDDEEPIDPTEQVATPIAEVTKGEEFSKTTKVEVPLNESGGTGTIYVPGGFGIDEE